ncbi:MAG: sulfatase-like hydrolase/transferase [Actinomycetota bacterium]
MSPKLVLVLVADQLQTAHLGFGGLALGHTPNLDRLAAAGLRFDRAHATNPICMPSRATLATGMWPSTHGTRTNGVPLDPAAVTIQGSLRRQGWATAAVGKLHYQPIGWPFSPDQLAELHAAGPDVAAPAIADGEERTGPLTSWGWEKRVTHAAAPVPLPDDYYGFAEVDLVVSHGDEAGGHYPHWARSRGFDPAELAGAANAEATSSLWSEVWRSQVPAEASTSAFVAEHAERRIEAASRSGRPTFLFVSFPDPHHPFCPPSPFADLIDPEAIELPRTFNADHLGLPPHLATIHARRGTRHVDPTFTWAVTEAQHREAMAAQLGLIAMLDLAVGRVLDAVDAVGLADDTLTVFTADHGELGGAHGLWMKHYVHYPAVTGVPLVIAGDGVDAGATDALVSNADLVPTLVDWTGTEPWRGVQGRSLRPILADRRRPGRNAVLVEEDQPIGLDGLPAPVRMRTLITDEARLTVYQGCGFGELYDHGADPDELHNVHDQDHDLRSAMTGRLLDEVLAVSDQRRRVEFGA